MIFQKSGFACIYSTRKNFKRPQRKIHFMYLLERTIHPNMLKIGRGILGMVSDKSGLGILKIFIFAHFRGQKRSKNPIWPPFLTFLAPKMVKNQNFQNPQIRFVRNHPKNACTKFQHVWMSGSLKKVHKVSFGYDRLKFFRAL